MKRYKKALPFTMYIIRDYENQDRLMMQTILDDYGNFTKP